SYDAIVCADVLEHLRSPGGVLAQLHALLKPEGRVLISVPNVGYAGIIAGLMAGEFRYRPVGLLDSTHLRFFTRSGLLELLHEHGFHARTVLPLYVDVSNTEFRDHQIDALPPAVLRALLAQPDALAYQFLIEALPGPGPAARVEVPPPPRFGLQLFFGRDGRYEEERSVRAAGVIGREQQVVELRIPPLDQPPSRLRLDLADRPGYLRLHELSLVAEDGTPLWTWDRNPASLPRLNQITFLGDLLLASGDDPSLELPIDGTILQRIARGGSVRVTLDWPMSGDFLLARGIVDERERAWA
ncbi:MAG: class I SAM-dependent methyltransferase, partial [Deltaproteobacteria bacterium]